MTDFHLIQVTEKLPPSLYGIGDYAYALASKFKEKYNIDSSFVIFDSLRENAKVMSRFRVYSLPEFGIALDEMIIYIINENKNKRNIVIMHFNGGLYDAYIDKRKFDRFHLSFELLRFVKIFKNKCIDSRLIIVFHELFYPFIERKRDLFLKPLQKIYIKKIIQTIDISFCSNPVVAKQIYTLNPTSKVFICPVFSNIGEPIKNQIESKQEGTWVIFGSTETLIRTLKSFLVHIYLIQKTQKINTVNILGGQKSHIILNLVNEIKKHSFIVNYHPEIPTWEASHFFKISHFCYIFYFKHNLSHDSALIFKSGVFAAACSHGVIPVFGNPGMENAIGVLEHPGFIFFKDGQFNFSSTNELDKLPLKLFNWYKNNSSLEQTVDIFYKSISSQ